MKGEETTQRQFKGVGDPFECGGSCSHNGGIHPFTTTPYNDLPTATPTMILTMVAVTFLTFPFGSSAR